jgi:hypothetical protein
MIRAAATTKHVFIQLFIYFYIYMLYATASTVANSNNNKTDTRMKQKKSIENMMNSSSLHQHEFLIMSRFRNALTV